MILIIGQFVNFILIFIENRSNLVSKMNNIVPNNISSELENLSDLFELPFVFLDECAEGMLPESLRPTDPVCLPSINASLLSPELYHLVS